MATVCRHSTHIESRTALYVEVQPCYKGQGDSLALAYLTNLSIDNYLLRLDRVEVRDYQLSNVSKTRNMIYNTY